MRVERKNLGNGVSRLEIVPTNHWESIARLPWEVKDAIMRDAMSRMRCEDSTCKSKHWETTNTWSSNCSIEKEMCSPNRRSYEELSRLKQTREPDGIDIHVDRPLKENFLSHHDWALAMAKYRTLEDVAKDCDWECREPMKGTEMFYHSNFEPCCEELSYSNVWDDDDDDDDDYWLYSNNGMWKRDCWW